MTDHDALLQAILEDPEDEGLRLVYADWLEERGDLDRAEFIRVQCELAHLPEGDRRAVQRRTRERALLSEHEEDWAGPLPGLAEDWEFRRGFVEAVVIRTEPFLRQAEAIFRSAPVRELRLQDATWSMAEVAHCHHLRHLTALDVGDNLIGDAGVRLLVCSPYLARLRRLGLDGAACGSDGLHALLSYSHLFPDLTDLELGGNHLGPEEVEALVGSPLSARLRRLNLSHNDFGDPGAETLAAAGSLDELRTLWLSWNEFGVRGVRALVRSRFWPHLVDLDLSFNPVTDAGANELLAACPTRLVRLSLLETQIGEPVQQMLRAQFGVSVCRFE